MGFFTRWKINRLIKDIKKSGVNKKNKKEVEYYLEPESVSDSDTIYTVRYELIPLLEEKNIDKFDFNKIKYNFDLKILKKKRMNDKKFFSSKYNNKIKSKYPKTSKNANWKDIYFEKEGEQFKINTAKIKKALQSNELLERMDAENFIFLSNKNELSSLVPKWAEEILSKLKSKAKEYEKKDKKIYENIKNIENIENKENNVTRSAILLNLFGFDNLNYIGCGGFNAVWADTKKNKVYKVCFKHDEHNELSQDQKKNAEIHDLIEKITKENSNKISKKKWIKYLSDAKPVDGIRIFESNLAKTDVRDHFLKKEKKDNEEHYVEQKRKTLESFFHKAKNVTKCVIGLHERGISINDLKIENILKIEKEKYNFSDEELQKMGFNKKTGIDGKEHWYDQNGKRKHKNFLQVTDMGGSTNIDAEAAFREHFTWTKSVNPGEKLVKIYKNEFKKTRNTKIQKRDIYPLGLVFLSFLIRKPVRHGTEDDLIKELSKVKPDCNEIFNNKFKMIYLEIYKNPIIRILELVSKMLSYNLKSRPSYDTILKNLKEIEKETKEFEKNYKSKK